MKPERFQKPFAPLTILQVENGLRFFCASFNEKISLFRLFGKTITIFQKFRSASLARLNEKKPVIWVMNFNEIKVTAVRKMI